MTDLSLPPLDLGGGAPPPPKRTDNDFHWPTPPYAAYPPPAGTEAELCVLEALDGSVLRGRLIALRPAQELAQVQVPASRHALPVRFSQFRRLSLPAPVEAVGPAPSDPHAAILDHRPAIEFRLRWCDGEIWTGHTVGHVETPQGLFLFPPAEGRDAVTRVFVPRSAYASIEFGPRIGEVLVDFQATTSDAVELAAQQQERMRNQKLGDILVTRHIVSPDQLLLAIEEQARMPMVRIGEALLALGLIDEAQLQEALRQQQNDRDLPLGELLVRAGMVSREDLQKALAHKMGYPVVDVANFPVEAEAVARVPYAVAARLNALPLLLRGSRLIVALVDPSRRPVVEELEFVAQCKVVPVLGSGAQLSRAVPTVYERLGGGGAAERTSLPLNNEGALEFEPASAGRLVLSMEQQQAEEEVDETTLEQSDNSMVRLVNTMIADAAAQGASDIHIETRPGREKVQVRLRRDGRLLPYLELPHTYRSALVARIKIMCDLDISERRKPQDGKINFAKFMPGQRLELRVVTIPTHGGLEDVVLRLLTSATPLPLGEIGLTASNLQRLQRAIERPYGMVLVVGPTGSGKTTTLHSALGALNTPQRKIWTAEDPVEITQAGLRQVQINPRIGWTFAKALRSFLRADPDVIMVGEIRDPETAQVAIEASLTGHLVMSTLHTNSAAETVTRLLDMGMDPFNFGDSLLAVLAQRLVRRLCTHCRVARAATEAEVEEWLDDWLHAFPEGAARPARDELRRDWVTRFGRDGELLHHSSAGCTQCAHTGYRGRAGVHELMTVSRELRRLIQTGARVEQLQSSAMNDGMRTLRQDGIEKVLQGLTSIEEVRATSNV